MRCKQPSAAQAASALLARTLAVFTLLCALGCAAQKPLGWTDALKIKKGMTVSEALSVFPSDLRLWQGKKTIISESAHQYFASNPGEGNSFTGFATWIESAGMSLSEDGTYKVIVMFSNGRVTSVERIVLPD